MLNVLLRLRHGDREAVTTMDAETLAALRLADEALNNYRGNFSNVESPENLETLDRATEAVRKVLARSKE